MIQKAIESGDDALSILFLIIKNGAVLRKIWSIEVVVTNMEVGNFAGVISYY